MNLNLDELYEVLYALEDKTYKLEDNGGDKVHIEYLKSIAKKIECRIEKGEA